MRGRADIGVSEKELNGVQVGTGFQQVGGEAVTQSVGRDGFLDAGFGGGLAHKIENRFGCDGFVFDVPWEEPVLGAVDFPMLAEGVEENRGEHDVAVLSSFPLLDVDEHAVVVDVGDPEMAGFRDSEAGSVEGHQEGALGERDGGLQQAGDFFRAEYGGQEFGPFGIGNAFGHEGHV